MTVFLWSKCKRWHLNSNASFMVWFNHEDNKILILKKVSKIEFWENHIHCIKMTHFMSAPGPYPWPGWLGWCPMQRSRTRLRVAMVGMLQIISGLDCDGNNNLITATTRPSTTSSSYTILPLCFSSTHTRQSANSAYHNSQPTPEAGLIHNVGSIIIGSFVRL